MKLPDKKQFILLLFGLGFLFPFLAWAIEISKYDVKFTLSGILEIHRQNPILVILDTIPVIFAFMGYLILKKKEELQKQFDTVQLQLNSQTENIKRVARFAEKIGNGHYDIDFEIKEKSDTLGKTIQNLCDKLYENNQRESLQNWEMVGKDKINQILGKHNDVNLLSREVLEALIRYIDVVQGIFYIYDDETEKLYISASYAYSRKKYLKGEVKVGEGLVGQAAIEKDIVYRTEIPENYLSITSGILGEKKPDSILIVPLFMEDKLQGTFEFASIRHFKPHEIEFLKSIAEIVAQTIYNLKITEKTERLLRESQEMTRELRDNEEKLRQNAEAMRFTQKELKKTNINLEEKIEEVNRSQKRLYSLLENASELITIYDENRKLKYVSPSVNNILGYTEDDMFAGKDLDRTNKKGQNTINQMFDNLLSNPDEPQKIQYSYLNRHGTIMFLETTGRNLLHNPAIKGLLLNTTDITERKRAEKEQRMRGQMQTLSDNSPDVIIRVDLNRQFFYANPAIECYSKLKSEEFHKKHLYEVDLREELTTFIDETVEEVIKKTEKIQKEISFPVNEELHIINANAIPEFNEEDSLETILFILHDITELKKIEQEIKIKNAKITDSINYAFRLQNALLPDQRLIKSIFPDSFLFYIPRDIVSGDFPWLYEKDGNIYIAAIDCTGHGVPGAMLSLIGYFLINQIVSEPRNYNAGQILDQLHRGVQKTLKQDLDDVNATRDGMDIALCKINKDKTQLQFAGAHRPLYHMRNSKLNEYKGTRSSIGGIPRPGKPKPEFENYVIDIEKGDAVYIFSDGLSDQFGGPEGKKYFPKRIKENIIKYNDKPMNQILTCFRNDYINWLGDNKQIDDVIMIGIRF